MVSNLEIDGICVRLKYSVPSLAHTSKWYVFSRLSVPQINHGTQESIACYVVGMVQPGSVNDRHWIRLQMMIHYFISHKWEVNEYLKDICEKILLCIVGEVTTFMWLTRKVFIANNISCT